MFVQSHFTVTDSEDLILMQNSDNVKHIERV